MKTEFIDTSIWSKFSSQFTVPRGNESEKCFISVLLATLLVPDICELLVTHI
jgi:hypothetical protein